jgi:Flp pilus assembly protein TadG
MTPTTTTTPGGNTTRPRRAPARPSTPHRAPRHPRRAADHGQMALELAVVAPVFIAMVLLIAGLGRVTHGRQLVDQAAVAAARAATLATTPGQATDAGRTAATTTLNQAGLSCRAIDVSLDTTAFHPGGQITATVRCTADLSGLALAGLPGSMTLQATSQAPLEQYRDLAGETP